jgi:hypothetical protein
MSRRGFGRFAGSNFAVLFSRLACEPRFASSIAASLVDSTLAA